jgi:uncharacterized membrane protein
VSVRVPLARVAPPRGDDEASAPGASPRHLLRVVPGAEPLSVSGAGWAAAGLWSAFVAIQVWTGALLFPWALPVALAGVLVGLSSAALALWRGDLPARAQLLLLAFAGGLTVARAVLLIAGSPGYGTDEVAFDQYAASLFLHGANPYAHSMAPALERFQVPDIYRTWLLSGGFVHRLSYPAGAFLAYVPALLAGLSAQGAPLTDVVFWVATAFVAWALLPPRFRFAPALLVSANMLIGFAVGGVTDSLYLPFLAVALFRFDRFSDPTLPAWQRWASPLALGVACSVKQTPWFLVPFLLATVALEAPSYGASRTRAGLAWLAAVAYVPVLVDLPFLIASPRAFLDGVLTPLLAPTVPGGQGLVGFAMFTHAGGLLQAYSVVGVAAATVAFAAFLAGWPASKRAVVPLVALVFFWPSRSFAGYLVELMPVALVAASTVRPAGAVRPGFRRLALGGLAVSVVGFGAATGLALSSRSPVSVSVVSEHSTGELSTIDQMVLSVADRGTGPVSPRYSVNQTGQQTAFWRVVAGPRTLRPGERATVVVDAPGTQAMPSLLGGFVVNAYTTRPNAIATSPPVRPPLLRTVLEPESVPAPVPVGRPVVLRVRLLDRFDAPVRRQGVRVDLGQVVYGQSALLPGEASIDGQPEGRTPVAARTDAAGVASFVVRGVQPQADPVFFQAWVVPSSGPPIAYSNMVAVRFVP